MNHASRRTVTAIIASTIFPVFVPLAQAGTEGSSSTFYGQSAGAGASPTSGANTFVGFHAGTNTTTGTNNSFLGTFAGAGNITGTRNTLMGYAAGYGASDAADNTFVGHAAGYANTSGTDNTYIGSYTGLVSTYSGGNTFVGSNAGTSTTEGGGTFIGYYAGHSNTTGEGTFIGTSAGYANTAGSGTFVGSGAGYSNTTGLNNSFIGEQAGHNNTTGWENTFLGIIAGLSNTDGKWNTYLGIGAGSLSQSGVGNVFLGYYAGRGEVGSNKLVIDNCYNTLAANCNKPFIYGEFDNHRLRVNGMTEVHANGAPISQMNFSQASTDTGGFLTSVLDNNFFMSSGARYDSGNWVQRSPDGRAVAAGSGSLGYRIFTSTGHAVGENFDLSSSVRLYINYNGEFGINTAPVAGDEIHTSSGAHLTSGGVWTDASSRSYKEHIAELSTTDAMTTLAALKPVTYNYKVDGDQKYVGFIAEDVPDLVARKDRKSLSPMDIVAVLTKVVQEKTLVVDRQKAVIEQQQQRLDSIEARLAQLEAATKSRQAQ